jgi:branched-chain amino acid transport system permease protein
MGIDQLQPVVNGILLGGLYAAVGVGLSIVFGVIRMVNLAHGDLMILASYSSLVLLVYLGVDPLVSLVAVAPGMFLLGFFVQKSLFNRVVRKGMEPPLITALGLSIVIQSALLLFFSPDARYLSSDISVMTIRVGNGLVIPAVYLLGFIAGLGTVLLLHGFFRGTRLGIAIRAASEDETTARLMGVNTDETYSYAMAIATATAAVAGTIVGLTFTFYPHSGSQYLLIAFSVAVIGGMGSMIGALCGGVVLGLAQLVGAHVLGPGYQLLCGYLALFAVLTLRPQGILGGMGRK